MIRYAIAAPLCALALAGCGPLQSPLPQRLEPEAQEKVDAAWAKSFVPVNRFDHQGLLDVMVGARAYESGIDSLTLRSEKRFAGGKAVMEIHYDRANPDQDRFEVSIFDSNSRLLRNERFGREEVESTYHDLFIRGGKDEPENDPRRVEREARWTRIHELFPDQEKLKK